MPRGCGCRKPAPLPLPVPEPAVPTFPRSCQRANASVCGIQSLNWGLQCGLHTNPCPFRPTCPDPPAQVSGPFCPPDPELRLHLGRVEVTGILPSFPAPYSHPATAALTEGKESSPHSPPPTQLCKSVREGATGGALRRQGGFWVTEGQFAGQDRRCRRQQRA